MRLSVNKDDPGFCAEAFRATVTVDGVKVEQCFIADEELGEAHCYSVPLELVGDEIKTEIKRGKVVIYLPVDNRE